MKQKKVVAKKYQAIFEHRALNLAMIPRCSVRHMCNWYNSYYMLTDMYFGWYYYFSLVYCKYNGCPITISLWEMKCILSNFSNHLIVFLIIVCEMKNKSAWKSILHWKIAIKCVFLQNMAHQRYHFINKWLSESYHR